MLQRDPSNPILKPDPEHNWENFAVFNGSVIKKDQNYLLFYRAMGEEQIINNKKLRLSTIGKALSLDGVNFNNRTLFIKPDFNWEKYGCEDPRVTKIDDHYLIFYTALANYPPNYLSIRSAVAMSKDLVNITEKHLVTPFNAKAMTIFPEKINGLYTVLLTVNTDQPPTYIACAQFNRLETLWNMSFWRDWYENLDNQNIKLRRVNSDQIEIGAPPLKTKDGWLLLYSYIKHYFSDNVKKEFRIEGVLLDLNNPQKIIGRVEQPLLIPEEQYECEGVSNNIVFPEGALIEKNQLKVYYGAADNYCSLATANLPSLMKTVEINSPATLKCQKFPNNPLLQPDLNHAWEHKAVFNPGVVQLEGKVYLIYRAVSEDNTSSFGLAISHDGMFIDERLAEPIYRIRTAFEKARKIGLAAGCEDPRLTVIDDRIYMCYTAFDGELPRLAFTSISIKDFLGRIWSAWTEPKVISPPQVADKDGALFPEKIDGKYIFFHRIEPDIVIDTVDDLEFKEKTYLDCQGVISPRKLFWDGVKIGVNTPPLRTKAGWLVFYHGISQIDRHYRIGALLLDVNNVIKVIGRTFYPVLEPETSFEKEGLVNNIVFPCGFILKGEEIFLYYGGADKVVCGAKINLEELLTYIIKSSTKKYLDY